MNIVGKWYILHCVMGKRYISHWHHAQVLYSAVRHGHDLFSPLTSWARALFYIASWASALYDIDIMGKSYISHCVMYKCYKPNSHHGLVIYFALCHRQVMILTSTSWASAIFHIASSASAIFRIDIMGKRYISNWNHGQVLYFRLPHGLVLNFILTSWVSDLFEIEITGTWYISLVSSASGVLHIAILETCYKLYCFMGKFYISHGYNGHVLYFTLTREIVKFNSTSWVSTEHHIDIIYHIASFHIRIKRRCYISQLHLRHVLDSQGKCYISIFARSSVLFNINVMGKCYIWYGHHEFVPYVTLRHGQVLYFIWTSQSSAIFTIASMTSAIFHIAIMGKVYLPHCVMGTYIISHCLMSKCYSLHCHHRQVL